MADLATERRLKGRARWKRFGLPLIAAAISLGFTILLGYRPVSALFNLTQNILLATVGSSDSRLIVSHPALKNIIEAIAAPAVWFILTLSFVSLPPVARLINYLFPDPPPFVFSNLDSHRTRSMMLIAEADVDFVGRQDELDTLRTMFAQASTMEAFAWRLMLGPSGVGKTRLAIEWLAIAQSQGWDIGIVDPEDYVRLANWRSRRPTALVIDEARSRWDKQLAGALLALLAGSTLRNPVRLLVVDQVPPHIVQVGAKDQHQLDLTQLLPPLMINEMKPDEIRSLVARLGCTDDLIGGIVHKSAGRPRAAIIISKTRGAISYADALHRWSELLVPGLTQEGYTPAVNLSIPLILAALVGPISAAYVRSVLPDYDAGLLLRFFPGTSRDQLEEALPRFLPEDLAGHISLLLLAKLNVRRRDTLVSQMLEDAPGRLESSLNSIWQSQANRHSAPNEASDTRMLRWIQTEFDHAEPDRVEILREQAGWLSREVKNATTLETFDAVLTGLSALTKARPFDNEVRLEEADGVVHAIGQIVKNKGWADAAVLGARLTALATGKELGEDKRFHLRMAWGAVNFIEFYGQEECWVELERWGALLIVSTTIEVADSDFQLAVAMGSANAMLHYGKLRRWNDLERWGLRLTMTAELEQVRYDHRIALEEAKGASQAIGRYGEAGLWFELERWGSRLIALVDSRGFDSVREIRVQEGMGAVNAVSSYGSHRRWADLERWGARLFALAEDKRFTSDPEVRLRELKASINAIAYYGGARRWGDMERWGDRIVSVMADELLSSTPEVSHSLAMCFVNAMGTYGEERRWADMEQWNTRLARLTSDKRFHNSTNIKIEEARACVNAILSYGRAGRLNDVENWGSRLKRLAENKLFLASPAAGLYQAVGAVHAIKSYGQAGLHASGRASGWRKTLAFVAQRYPTDAAVQARAAEFGLTWVSQSKRDFEPYGRIEQA